MLKHKEYQEKKMGGKTNQQPVQKKQKWKKQSEEFRAIMRQGKDVSNTGKPFFNTQYTEVASIQREELVNHMLIYPLLLPKTMSIVRCVIGSITSMLIQGIYRLVKGGLRRRQ
jgi:hypothetical protein